MINCQSYYRLLQRYGIKFFAGVPDSILKDFHTCVSEHTDLANDIIASNEGAAVALAAGHYLATKEFGMVYMQNSGLGNAIDPLTSLVNHEVYCIPMLLLISWRGEPGYKDEPQHVKQGKITLPLLGTLGVPYEVHPRTKEKSEAAISRAVAHMNQNESPYALVVRAKTFSPYKKQLIIYNHYKMTREDAIKEIAANLKDDDIIVSTTGKTSRELFEYRAATGGKHDGDFLNVGAMGHASQIALAIALAKPERQIYCFDGDGASIMHMGSMAIIGSRKLPNYKHIIFNNGSHDSVGGQPTVGYDINIPAIALACGYRDAFRVERKVDIAKAVRKLRDEEGAILLEVLVNKGARPDLSRPTISLKENKKRFIRNLAR